MTNPFPLSVVTLMQLNCSIVCFLSYSLPSANLEVLAPKAKPENWLKDRFSYQTLHDSESVVRCWHCDAHFVNGTRH